MIRLAGALLFVAIGTAAADTGPVPAEAPAKAAAQDHAAATRLLRQDSRVRGRIVHKPGYAASQQRSIHQERETYLRNGKPPAP